METTCCGFGGSEVVVTTFWLGPRKNIIQLNLSTFPVLSCFVINHPLFFPLITYFSNDISYLFLV